MGRETEDVRADDLPAIVILVQLVHLIVSQVVSCEVIAQYPHLWGEGEYMAWGGECVHVCVWCVCVCICVGGEMMKGG